eukprot:2351156-Lingulodinium_polyedra.AAC.1
MVGEPVCPELWDGGDGVLLLEHTEVGAPVRLAGQDAVQLAQGEFALVPATVAGCLAGFTDGHVTANGAAPVVAAPGPWLGQAEQLVLIGNLDQPQVCLEPGEVVAAVLPPAPAAPPAS